MGATCLSPARSSFCVMLLANCPLASWPRAWYHSFDAETGDRLEQASFWETVDGKPAELSWEFPTARFVWFAREAAPAVCSAVRCPPTSNWLGSGRSNPGATRASSTASGRFGQKWLGFEYQIIDEPPTAARARGSTASIYDLVEPPIPNRSTRPATGTRRASWPWAIEWNITLMGQLVAIGSTTTGPTWEARSALSKFWDAVGFGQAGRGRSNHADRPWRRGGLQELSFCALMSLRPMLKPPPARRTFSGQRDAKQLGGSESRCALDPNHRRSRDE